MRFTDHAQQVANRFREIVENSGDVLPINHYDELSLLIEAAIDTALLEQLEAMAKKMESLAHDLRHNAEIFE